MQPLFQQGAGVPEDGQARRAARSDQIRATEPLATSGREQRLQLIMPALLEASRAQQAGLSFAQRPTQARRRVKELEGQIQEGRPACFCFLDFVSGSSNRVARKAVQEESSREKATGRPSLVVAVCCCDRIWVSAWSGRRIPVRRNPFL